MNSDSLEARVYAHVRKHDGFYLFGKPELTEQTDLDFDLQLDEDEALALMEDFFTSVSVCVLYTSVAYEDLQRVDLVGRGII